MKKFGDFLREGKDDKIAAHDSAWRELLQHDDLVHDFVEILMNMIIEKSGIKFQWDLHKRSASSKYATPKPGDKDVYYELRFKTYQWPGSPTFFSEEAISAYLQSLKKTDEFYKLFKGGRGDLKEMLEKNSMGNYPWKASSYATLKNETIITEITHNGVTSDGRKLCRLYDIDYWAIFNTWKETSNVRGILLGKDLNIL